LNLLYKIYTIFNRKANFIAGNEIINHKNSKDIGKKNFLNIPTPYIENAQYKLYFIHNIFDLGHTYT